MNNSFNNQLSDYPDVFFTNRQNTEKNKNNNSTCSYCGNTIPTSQQSNSNLQPTQSPFNMDMLKNLLPLLTSKGGGMDFSSILGKFNPQISNIFSMFGVNKKNENKKNVEKASSNSIIDISDYTEVS